MVGYADKKVAPFVGVKLMKVLLYRLRIRDAIDALPMPYYAYEIIEGFWLSIWAGAGRFIHFCFSNA